MQGLDSCDLYFAFLLGYLQLSCFLGLLLRFYDMESCAVEELGISSVRYRFNDYYYGGLFRIPFTITKSNQLDERFLLSLRVCKFLNPSEHVENLIKSC